MKYEIINASNSDISILINYKLASILDYATNLSDEEIEKIRNYVDKKVPEQIQEYKVICVKNKKIGSILVTKYEEGYLLDEIYLEKEYRGLGIGTSIIKNIIDQHNKLYLWVYKNNTKAFNLYLKLGFDIVKETETRYFMEIR